MMFPAVYETLKASPGVTNIAGSAPLRAYAHGDAPQTPVPPYIVWLIVGSEPQNNLSERASSDRVSIQVDCYHQTDAGIKALAQEVRWSLETKYTYDGMIINERDRATGLYRVTLQFDCWQSN